MRLARTAFRSIVASALASTALPAFAQPADETDDASIPEIIVTAQKREQAAIDVPISLSAIGSEQLEAQQINDLRDFVGQVPNLFVNNFNGRNDTVRLFIRGIGQNDVTLTQDPSVALYVDGIYVGTTIGGGFETEDLERIEVLRGPQGSLYGRNATGGAVNLISMKPQTDRFSLKASTGYGNYDAYRFNATVNAPLGDSAAIRLTGSRSKRDGLQENTGIGRDFAELDSYAFRAAVRVKPTDAFTIDYAFDHSRNEGTIPLSVPTAGAPVSFPVAAPFPIPGTFGLATGITQLVNSFTSPAPFVDKRPDSAQALRLIPKNDGKVSGHALTLDYEASDALTLRSITGLRRINNEQTSDNLPTHQASIVTSVLTSMLPMLPVGTVLNTIGPNGAAYATDFVRFKSFSEELQAIGQTGSLEYVLGGYYYEDRARMNVLGGAIGSGPLILENFTTIRNTSYAAFGEVTFRPGGEEGKFSATVGARYSHDKRAATRINERSFSFAALGGFTAQNCTFFALTFQALGQTCTPTGAVVAATYADSFNNFSPSLTIAYKASDDVNVYAKYVRGYKAGGTSQRSSNPINFANGFRPENVSSVEAGIKANILDRRASVTFAGFYMKLNNFQTSVQTGASAGDRDFIGIDGNEIYGIEFDLTASLSRELRVGLSGAILKTTIGQRSASVLLDTGATQVQNFVDEQSYAPKSSGSVFFDYDRELSGDWSFGAHGNVSYQGKTQTSANILDNRTIGARAIVDGSLSLTRALGDDRSLSLRLWGKNLFDKEYKTVTFGSFAFAGSTTVSEFGEPRTYGATVSLRY